MRPLRLRMKAFGPYSKTAEVDFRKLGADGLFLIHGATGAGKTSILDGISFALFGRASGSDRNPEGLRSDLSSDDLSTEAVLEFAIGGEVYRARREPRQMLKKKRGEGLRTVNPDGSLEKLVGGNSSSDLDSGEWQLLAAGEKKTDAAINELLGMSEEQFRQVVVLPQGQFRKFLSAGSDERERLLARLFRTDRFQKIEDLLEERSRVVSEQIANKKRTLESLLTSLEVASAEELGVRLEQMSKRLAEVVTLEPSIKKSCELASRKLEEARALKQAFTELEKTKRHLQEIESLRPQHERDLKRVDDEKRARPVVELNSRWLTLEKDLLRLAGDRDSALKNEAAVAERAKAADAQLASIALTKTEIENSRAERDRLKQVFIAAKQLSEQKEKLIAAEKAVALYEKEAAEAEYSTLWNSFHRAGELQSQISGLHEATEKAIAVRETELKRAQMLFHLSEASRLAESLEDGKPCAVCGSLEHPKPARKTEDGPTKETIEFLEHGLSDLKLGLSQRKLAAGKLESEWRALGDLLRKMDSKPSRSFAQNPAAVASTDRAVSAEGLLKTIDEANEKLQLEADSFRGLLTEAELDRKKKQDRVDESRRTLDALTGSVRQLESSVPEEDRSLEAIKTRGQALTKKIEEFDTGLKAATEKRDSAKAELAAIQARVRTLQEEADRRMKEKSELTKQRTAALKNAAFATLEACVAAAIPAQELAQLEKSIRDFDRDATVTVTRVSELSAKIKGAPPTDEDLAGLEQEKAKATDEQSRLLAEKLHLENSLKTTESMRERIAKLTEDGASLASEHAKIGRLSEVAAGRHPNLSRVSFQRYVLAARLDEVLEQASRRLFTMSRGQFVLRRARGVEDKRKAAGLDVEVEDALSGKTRPTSSLSGGEGFLASLALAMGLSDVVQAHLGGVRLDAVFVDEGFGTLDPEALDLAMDSLSGLRSGGRLVGIISHVPELKDQIANRLVVRKSSHGSTVAWETALA